MLIVDAVFPIFVVEDLLDVGMEGRWRGGRRERVKVSYF